MKDQYIKTNRIKWEEIQKDVFEKPCLANKKGISFSLLKIKPNKEIPMHKHTDTRYNFILKGSMSNGKQIYKKGDLLINKKGSSHFLRAGKQGCELLLIWD